MLTDADRFRTPLIKPSRMFFHATIFVLNSEKNKN
jgi:hypothetical protein